MRKNKTMENKLIPIENIIYEIRGYRVMLDSDLARLYEIETKSLNRAVKRNIERFPDFFMFQLTKEEVDSLRCQIGTSKEGKGGRRYLPYAFTEHDEAINQIVEVLNNLIDKPQPKKRPVGFVTYKDEDYDK